MYLFRILYHIFLFTDLTDTLQWPDLTICKSPTTKNGSNYATFMQKGRSKSFANLDEFNDLERETFYTNPEDFITALGISNDYETLRQSSMVPSINDVSYQQNDD